MNDIAGDEWFDRKFPHASCNRCDKSLTSKSVQYCGGGSGGCETWYCAECLKEGTYDCKACAEEDELFVCIRCKKEGFTEKDCGSSDDNGFMCEKCFDEWNREPYQVICEYCKNGLTQKELDERTEQGNKSICFDCIPSENGTENQHETDAVQTPKE